MLHIVNCFRSRCRLRIPAYKAVFKEGNPFCCNQCATEHQREVNHPNLDSPPTEREVCAAIGQSARWFDHPYND